MDDTERRAALSHFLRTRRERLSPQQVGLPTGGRRRTPGLRREEVAQIAGVGVAWYTWLEQGRSITVSAAVLDSIARALRLAPDERAYLFTLARDEAPRSSAPAAATVSPALQSILDALDPYPAYVTDARWTVVAWNQAARRVFANFEAMSRRQRNILWFAFMQPGHRELLVDWEGEAQRTLALFRASTGRYVGEPWYKELIADLARVSPAFEAWWSRDDVRAVHAGRKELNHPEVGRLVFHPTTMQIAEAPDLQMVVYPPLAEADTARKLCALIRSDPADRVVERSDTATHPPPPDISANPSLRC